MQWAVRKPSRKKRMGLFKELVPDLKRLGFIGTATSTLAVAELSALRSVAGHFGFEIVHHAIVGLDDIESAVSSSKADGVDALDVPGEPHSYPTRPLGGAALV